MLCPVPVHQSTRDTQLKEQRGAYYLQIHSEMTQVHGAQEGYLAKSMECGKKICISKSYLSVTYEATPGVNKW